MNAWIFDRESNEHHLPFSCGDAESRTMKIYKTTGGDYAITCHYESTGHGGEVEYAATLKQAKRDAELFVCSGHWYDLAP